MIKQLLIATLLFPLAAYAFLPVQDVTNLWQNTATAGNTALMVKRQVEMLINQGEQIKQQIKHLNSFSKELHWQNVAGLLQQVDELSRRGQSLSYAMSGLHSYFSRVYPDYGRQSGRIDYTKAYQQWNETSLSTYEQSLKAIGLTSGTLQDDAVLLAQLKSHTQSASGSLQVMQAANEIAAVNVNQLQRLQRIVSAQTNAQVAFMAKQTSRESYEDKKAQQILDKLPSRLPPAKHDPFFDKIRI